MNDDTRAIVAQEPQHTELSVPELLGRRKKIREAVASIMKPNVHYGKVPGCPKDSLWQPGAEVLYSLFQLEPELQVEDMSTPDEIRYRVRVRVIHWPTGNVVGRGVGECSTGEEKYAWRAAVCEEEYEETPDDLRRKKWKKGYKTTRPESILQIRTNPSDLANTVLKMAAKRARVDGAKSTVGVSDMFTQDEEVVDEPMAQPNSTGGTKKATPTTPPKEKQVHNESVGRVQMPEDSTEEIPPERWSEVLSEWHDRGTISEKQRARLFAIAIKSGWSGDDAKRIFEESTGHSLADLPWGEPYDLTVSIFEEHGPQVAA